MIVAMVDDEPLALRALEAAVKEAKPTAELHSFSSGSLLLSSIQSKQLMPDVAFLDIELPGIGGIELAKQIKLLSHQTWIVFVTGFTQYAVEAFQIRAKGYVMKPVSTEAIRAELEEMKPFLPQLLNESKIRVQTFGNFEVYFNGRVLPFGRSKAKEIFAYLIDRRGASVSRAEIASIIWEDGYFDRPRQKQLQIFISDMGKTPASVGEMDVVIRQRTGIAIDPAKVGCDYYRLLDGDPTALNAYTGEYMTNYAWAELTVGYLNRER
ncbi:MAG: response regulator [Eubacteriales bacterium]|nr:response regulator [Eubacteriales bacterium]